MKFTEAAEARDRLEASLPESAELSAHESDIALVCAWTRHWEHACTELDAMLAAEKQRAAALKVYTPDNGQEPPPPTVYDKSEAVLAAEQRCAHQWQGGTNVPETCAKCGEARR